MSECLLNRLRHTLDLKRKDPEVGHHLRHCRRDHSKVLSARKHSGRVEQGRKLLHSLVLPELVVTIVEEVGVKLVEGTAAVCIKDAVRAGLLCTDLRMVVSRLMRILYEEFLVLHIESLALELGCRVRKCRREVSVKTTL